ncbi:MAG: RNA polymerase sigma factor [Polyangiaceae bacterium]
MTPTSAPNAEGAHEDDVIVARVLAGEIDLFEILMRKYNARVYRAARSVLRDDAEAEDVMQDAYVRAFANLAQFEGRAAFGTWLTRIAVHEALARARRRGKHDSIDVVEERAMSNKTDRGPEAQTSDNELRKAIERAVDKLSDGFREVFVLRAVVEMSVAEVASSLDIAEDTVKTRYFRARAQLRESLEHEIDRTTPEAFPFHLSRCDRVVTGVLTKIHQLTKSKPGDSS